jgi:hypothetical protein
MNGTYSGRTGRGPLARRARVKCECEDGKLCLQVFLSLFGLTPSYFPFITPLPNTHTDFGRTVHNLDERDVWRTNGQDRLAAMRGCGHTVRGY